MARGESDGGTELSTFSSNVFLQNDAKRKTKGDDAQSTGSSRSGTAVTFTQFARRFFSHKGADAHRHQRTVIKGPLLKQIWGDGDAERMVSTWVSILRFIGDMPPPADNPLSNLELVQHICNIAITRPNTRDEIYCQLCKQLTDNANKASHARGWILLALCCGIFVPSNAFLRILRNFIINGPPGYRDFVLARLDRCVINGTRSKPPTSLEIQMAFIRKPIIFDVNFYVGAETVECDSQTTAREVLEQVHKNKKFEVESGFSVFVTSPDGDQITSLGSGNQHVMDVIQEYEAAAAGRFRNDWQTLANRRPWTVLVRKEVFAPWFEGKQNIELIYRQIVDGLERGFYRCDSDEQLALFLAQRYYITQGYKLDEKQLRRQLKRDRVVGMESRSTSEWVDMVTRAFDSREYYANTCSAEDVQVEVVQMVRQQWYMSFSQRFTDVSVAIGKKVYDGLTLCINSEGGIAVQETRNSRGVLSKTVADMRFIHIAEISEAAESDEDEDLTVFTVTVVLPKRTKFRVTHANGGLMQSLLWSYYQGMRNRSKYCMATLPYRAPGSESSFLSCDRGDVIILPKIWAEVDDGGWANGVSERTNAKGDFPTSNVFVLPAMARPAADVMAAYKKFFVAQGPTSDDDDL